MKHGGSLRRLALALEWPLRRNIPWLRFAGLFTILLIRGAEALHPWAGNAIFLNFADGVTLGGPVVAMTDEAVSTSDFMPGYKDERCLLLGWASARTDDVANGLPARLTAPLAAPVFGCQALGSLRQFLRGGWEHPSPNAGSSEAAPGAPRVQLGGLSFVGGEAFEGPRPGDPLVPLDRQKIPAAHPLMLETSLSSLLFFTGLRATLVRLWSGSV